MLTSFKEENKIEVRENVDVIVLGGGPAGVTAAIAAARHGVRVLIVEKSTILGGLATEGQVGFFVSMCDGNGRQITAGLAEELFYRSVEYSYNTIPSRWERGNRQARDPNKFKDAPDLESEVIIPPERGRMTTNFNIPAFALALEETVLKAGAEILYDTLFCRTIMNGDTCEGIVVENISGRYAIGCKFLIDASGSSIAFHTAGAKCQTQGNNFTVCYMDTDFKRMAKAVETKSLHHAFHWRVLGWVPYDEGAPRELFGHTIEGENEYLLMSHKAILEFLKEHRRDPAEGYAIHSIPTMASFRFIRHIEGRTVMQSGNDWKRMEDSIGCVADWRKSGPAFEVPYPCILCPTIKNMIAVGRNISADLDMWDVTRCFPGAMTTGQAGGTAAAMALHENTELHMLSIPALQKTLEKDNVMIHL